MSIGGEISWLQSTVYRNWKVYHAPILSENWIHQLLNEELPKKDDNQDTSLLKFSHDSIVLRRPSDIGDLAAKIFKVDTFKDALSNTLLQSRGKKSWLNGLYLKSLNITTPEPLAFMEQKKNGLIWRSWLICRYQEGTSCNDYFVHSSSFTPALANSASAIVALLIELRDKQLSHGCLTSDNILITHGQPSLINLEALSHHNNTKKAEKLWFEDIYVFMESWRERYDIYKKFQQAFSKYNININ